MNRSYRSPDDVPTRSYAEHPFRADEYVPVRRTRMRHPDVDYRSADCFCFVTWRVSGGVRLTGAVGAAAWEALQEVRAFVGFTMHAACIMPDHVHAVLVPSGRGESVSDIVRSAKLRIAKVAHERTGLWVHWQGGFYDEVMDPALLSSRDVDAIVRYVESNPVRSGIVATPEVYPYSTASRSRS